MSAQAQRPALLVYSSLFPSPVQPNAGVFVRERMFRVGAHLPIVVVAPTPWFPFQSVLRMFKPHFRPMPPAHQQQDGKHKQHQQRHGHGRQRLRGAHGDEIGRAHV